jgi:ABC-2 type transport system ATP-binding protein
MIQINNVSKSYDGKNNVIDGMNLQINDGEIFGFLGPNGAGKTTTIKMITGILNIDKGDILIDGISITSRPVEAKQKFGFVPDSPDMFLKLKGSEYLNFIADIYQVNTENRTKRIKELVTRFDMQNCLENKIQTYSHGMRQKIVIIASLLSDPKNWIIDEPMTGLDPKATYELKKIMHEKIQKGDTVFFSTHILDVAEKLCTRVGIINNGKLIFVGSLEEMKIKMKENCSLEELYMEIIKND